LEKCQVWPYVRLRRSQKAAAQKTAVFKRLFGEGLSKIQFLAAAATDFAPKSTEVLRNTSHKHSLGLSRNPPRLHPPIRRNCCNIYCDEKRSFILVFRIDRYFHALSRHTRFALVDLSTHH
jgi:hypothetical protein